MILTSLQTDLNTLISNTTGFTFTSDETLQICTSAFNDKWAVQPVWDTSLTFTQSTYQYPLPADITTVSAVYVERSTANLPEEISAELWEVINGNLQFNDAAAQMIPSNYQLFLRGKYKIQTTDTVNDVGLQEYLRALAGYYALRNLLFKKTMQFLRNDTSVAEIVATRRELYQDVVRWRQQIGNEFVNN